MGLGSYLGANMKAGLKPVVDLVYPPRCPLCGEAIAEQGGLCTQCWSELDFPGEPACALCNLPIADRENICFHCETSSPLHAGIHAACVYNDASRKLVLAYKHGRKIALARLMARLMAARLPATEGGDRLLIPVPLHRWRLWHRGFNQAALLADELARLGRAKVLVDALVRQKRTPSLGGLGRSAREQALAGAIAVRDSHVRRISGEHVLLVDDVLTSGATSHACTTSLLKAGAASVEIACFARVVDGAHGNGKPANETPETIKAPGAT
ncbi:ComF family protein [Erythrobacter sp. GH1-10]|uniref:ComF family protein n=1 Tax=Erythrobacter sp. GH1-10 TaxID=3349334 RepID=UPI0038781AAE